MVRSTVVRSTVVRSTAVRNTAVQNAAVVNNADDVDELLCLLPMLLICFINAGCNTSPPPKKTD